MVAAQRRPLLKRVRRVVVTAGANRPLHGRARVGSSIGLGVPNGEGLRKTQRTTPLAGGVVERET